MEKMSVNWQVLFSHSEFYFLFLIPTIISVAIAVKSFLISKRRRKYPNGVFTFAIIFLVLPAEWALYEIFFEGGWPSYIPHLMIGLAVVLFGLQFFLAGKATRVIEKNES